MARRNNDKRIRLIQAADQLFHKQGVNVTTLANIASLAEVPLGNVYYYFKSKELIIKAVADYRKNILQELFDKLEDISDHKSRLKALVHNMIENRDSLSSHGDALGSLCHELGKHCGTDIAEYSSSLMKSLLTWVEQQFTSAGKSEKAKALASNFVACLQGINLLTLSLKDTDFTEQQGSYLLNWLETV